MKGRKGQEEMVGFVLIVVVVAVILLVFLGFAFRESGGGSFEERGSKDISQFLDSAMRYTTDCAISYVPAYSSVEDLIKECFESSYSTCVSGAGVCDALKTNLKGILDASWNVGEESLNKGYEFRAVYDNNVTKEDIVKVESGNCTGNYLGSERITSAYPGTIISSFKLCR